MIMLPKGLSAQESLMEFQSLYSNESIIRMIDDNDWLVCCRETRWKFVRIRPGGNPMDIMALEPYIASVTDFKIHEGFVYFCGLTNENMPYMARFAISGFPHLTFECEYLARASKVNKLEVYGSVNSVVHVVMTGQNLSGYGILVEAMSMGWGWNVYYSLLYDEKGEYFIFDDIAISDTIAAVTSYEREEQLDSIFTQSYTRGRVWFLKVPSVINPLISSVMRYVDMPYRVTPPFIVREADPNTFIVAASGKLNTSTNVYVNGFLGANHYATATFPYDFSIKDLSYNPNGRTTDVILNHFKIHIPGSEIYTLLPGMATTPGLSYGHKFDKYYWNSIVYNAYNPDHHICVGYFYTSPYILSLAEYHYNYVSPCSKQVEVTTGIFEWLPNIKIGDKSTVNDTIAYTARHADPDGENLDTICFKRYTETE